MAQTLNGLNSDIPLVKTRAMPVDENDDLRVFSGMMVAGAASILLWVVVGIVSYAAYRLF